MSRLRLEQETTITFNAEEPMAHLWTAWPPMQRKLEKNGIKHYDRSGDGKFYLIDKKLISIRSKRAAGTSKGNLDALRKAREVKEANKTINQNKL